MVVANVVLKSSSGKPVVQMGSEISPRNIKEFLPKKETVDEATKLLKELDFRIDQVADTHISISGPAALFEKVFNVRLKEKSAPVFQGSEKGPMQPYYESTEPAKVPPSLSKVIEAIEFPVPPVYFSTPVPPPLPYDHLEVPDDVTRDMDAMKAHLRGVTGNGIRLVLLDSGFMTPHHPYYVGKGYNIQPIIPDPSDPNPQGDAVGHGTGIAACALAVAPGVTFIPVKIYTNLTADFTRAVNQNPNIITNSWGSFHNQLQPTLRLAINNAVANGIVVLFACGNGTVFGNGGTVSWPASEPAVISIGGTFMGNDDSIQASSYASSGTEPNNPGRQCPDLCGLTGMAPMGIYIALPTQPNSQMDNYFSGGTFPNGDQTTSSDGWLVASGTSSASPMVAGVVALLMESDPSLVGNPAAVRVRLTTSCLDVAAGASASGQAAGPGSDLATGQGLVQAYRAVNLTDIWLRDNPNSDVGLVPTHNRRPMWPPYAHWVSPDVKVFSAPLTHPDADFDPTPEVSPIFQQDSYVYVRVRNRGTQPTGSVSVRLYYADPCTNLVYPSDWKDGQSGIPAQGSMNVAGAPTNLQTFPSVASSGQNVLPQAFVWRPPDPTTATQTQTLPDGRISGHFCLLVRLETADDPITIPGGAQASVINDNNIGMKNVGVYSGAASTPFALSFLMKGATEKEGGMKNDLLLDLSKLPEGAGVILQLDRKELGKVEVSHGELAKEGVRLTPHKRPAGIHGLILKPGEKVLAKVLVRFPSNVIPRDYPIPIVQASRGKTLGGITFVARVTKNPLA